MPLTDEEKKAANMAAYEAQRKHEDELRKIERELSEQKSIVQELQTIVVRGLVILKHLARVFALVGCWFWVGHKETYFLAGYIAVVGLFQLVIDKVRKIVNPKVALSEWDVL